MRHNYSIRKSNIVDYFDTEYDFLPDQPYTSKIIDHPRKLVTVNLCADPYHSEPVEILRDTVSNL